MVVIVIREHAVAFSLVTFTTSYNKYASLFVIYTIQLRHFQIERVNVSMDSYRIMDAEILFATMEFWFKEHAFVHPDGVAPAVINGHRVAELTADHLIYPL